MPGRLGHEEIVGLGGLNVAQSRSSPHHVDDHHRDLGAGDVGQPLRHQREPWPRGGGHHTGARAGRPIDHIDRRHLALGLQEHPPLLDHPPGEMLQGLTLRRDGVAEVGLQPVADCRLCECDVAFKQLFHHDAISLSLNTRGDGPGGTPPRPPRPTIDRKDDVGADCRTRGAACAL